MSGCPLFLTDNQQILFLVYTTFSNLVFHSRQILHLAPALWGYKSAQPTCAAKGRCRGETIRAASVQYTAGT